MLISRAFICVCALAAILGGLLVVPPASAVEAPGASVFALQTNGPNGLVTLGDWYTSNAVGAGGGHHYVRFTIPCGWPAGLPVFVDLFSPEMNRVSGALAQSEEPNGAYDSTQFELYGPGATVGPGYASPGPGAGIPGTRTTFQPGAAGVPEAWMRYATLTAPVACGSYVVRSQVLTTDPLNPAGTGDDQNGWHVRVGTDADADPTNAPPANYDNPDGLVGTNDELTLGVDQASFQQDSGALACQTFFEYVSPGQASIVFHNFDMDGNTRIRYYAPSDASYDPNANAGGVLGTLSSNGQWNGGTLATRVGDTILNPESGWWRFVTCISSQNQFIQEGEAGRAAYYTQPPTPNLTIAKSDGMTTVAPGQTITYTIDVDNVAAGATAGAANNVVVQDLLPAGVTYQSCSSPVPAQGTWACSESGGNVTFTQNGWMDAGDAAQLAVTARVNQGTSGSIVNNATADYTDQIGNPFLQVTASDTDTIAPSADLTLTKTDGVASVTAGTSTTYSITLTNNGPTDEPAGVVLTDQIPPGTSASENESDCGLAATTFTCTTTVALASGTSVVYRLTLAIDAAYPSTTLVNTAGITSSPIADPNPANNTATDTDTVNAVIAELSVVKTDSADPVQPGDTFSYTIAATNDGPGDATDVVLSDALPAALAVAGVSSSGTGTCVSALNVVTCSIDPLGVGAVWTVIVQVTVRADAVSGTVTNTATVAAGTGDTDPSNDAASQTTTIDDVGSADLTVTKTVDDASPQEGDIVTYTVSVTNGGPDDATAVQVTDTLPAGLSIVSASVTQGSYDPATGVWIVGSLTVGETAGLRLRARVDDGTAGTTITNRANVSAADPADPTSEDDADSAPIAVEAAGGGGGTGAGGGTALTGFPGAAGAIAWMLGLVSLGLAALGLGGRRRSGEMRSSDPGGSGGAPPAGRFLCEPFFFCKE